MRFATPAQINALAAEVPRRYRALVLLAGYYGLRWGDLVELRRHRVDLEARTVAVVEQITEIHGHLRAGAPKSEAGKRVVTMPRFVADALTEHLATRAEMAPKGSSSRRPRAGSCGAATSAAASGCLRSRRLALRPSASTTFATARRRSPRRPEPTRAKLMERLGHASHEAAIRNQHVVAEGDVAIGDPGGPRQRQAAQDPAEGRPKWHGLGTRQAEGSAPVTRQSL